MDFGLLVKLPQEGDAPAACTIGLFLKIAPSSNTTHFNVSEVLWLKYSVQAESNSTFSLSLNFVTKSHGIRMNVLMWLISYCAESWYCTKAVIVILNVYRPGGTELNVQTPQQNS